METLTAEHNGDRTIVRLNRPQTLNSIDQAMVDDLHEVCDQLEREPRILILTGTRTDKGGIFASGADISQLRDRRRHDALRGINSSIFARIAALPMPVIAAIDGYALGGGAELAYAADFRIATTRVKIGNPEPNLGIIAAAGACWRLVELVGEPVAKEILLAGRVLTADEALSIRLVGEVCEAGWSGWGGRIQSLHGLYGLVAENVIPTAINFRRSAPLGRCQQMNLG